MATTYEPIATTTLSSSTATFTFSSIPATYTDLRLVIVPISNTNNTNQFINFNGDTGANYSNTHFYGNGSAASTFQYSSQNDILIDLDGVKTTKLTFITLDIFSYTAAVNKTVLGTFSEDNNGSGQCGTIVGLWRDTSAITSITFKVLGATTYVAGTKATLYGIKAA